MIATTPAAPAQAETIPSAYQYDVDELQQMYPGTRNQGNYNTCWAFSAVGLAEFDLIHDDKIADKSIDLSELQLSYYTYHNEVDPFGGTYGDGMTINDYLMGGGHLFYCTRTLLQWEGLIRESDLPYDAAGSLNGLDLDYAFNKDVAHLQNVYTLNIHKQPQDVKKEIMKHGAAGIGFYTGGRSGRYNATTYYGRTGDTVATFYCPTDNKQADHAVNIVGWDDDFPATGFKTQPQGNGAWLIRNSWSDQTGNDFNSYFWMSYYDKGLEDDAWILDFEPADNYDYNYQYDGSGYAYKAITFFKEANVFKVDGAANQQLKAVSISIMEDTNVPYTIKVYTNLANGNNPTSGILATTVTGKTSYAGTYTIPLKKAVSVPKGTKYAVVVEFKKENTGVDLESSARRLTLIADAYSDYGQSFGYYQGKWRDLAELLENKNVGNLCIKAFTDKSGADIGRVSKLRKTGTTKNSVKLSWTKVSGAKGYEIYRATSKNGTYKKVVTTSKTSYQDKKLSSKKTYYYKVRAYKTSGGNTIDGKLTAAVKTQTK